MKMSINEYFITRKRNDKICIGVDFKDGIASFKHNGLKMPQDNDLYHVTAIAGIGGDMEDFWNNAKSQKDLLWALRGIGMDDFADIFWNKLVSYYDLKFNSVFIDSNRSIYADWIRMHVPNPFC